MVQAKVNLKLQPNLTETIYERIKKLICDGKLKPGQRITISEFTNYFNVSITPVRGAMNRLGAEGYLISESANRKEFKVINITQKDIDDIYELFQALEIFGLKKNIESLPESLINELLSMHELLGKYYKEKQLKLYFRQNYSIHSRIWSATQNGFIYKTMVAAQSKILIFIGLYPDFFYSPDVLERSFLDHCELMEGLKSRDIVSIERVLERHWGKGFFSYKPLPDRFNE